MRLTLLTIATLLLSLCSFGQEDLPEDYLSPQFHKGRREAARAMMPANSVMVVFAAPQRTYSNDVEYHYHQNPDLYYFTGYKEPNAVLLLFKEPQIDANGDKFTELFFVQKRDALRESWDGRRLGEEGVKAKLGITAVKKGEDFAAFAPALANMDVIITDPLPNDVRQSREEGNLYNLLGSFKTALKEKQPDQRSFRRITTALREIKTEEEMNLLRKAVEISCQAHNEVMKTVHPGMSELEIQGLQEFVHKKYGAEGVGYGSIIGAGENGCILHYVENTKTRVGSGLVLMDVGAEYHGYTADVTRTIPVDGKFSAEEKAIYQLVYDAQEAAFKTLKQGSRWRDASAAARQVIAEGLVALGITKDVSEVGKYYIHGLGHHIGLDVHDKGSMDTLKTDMVLTIEPGIYIPSGSNCDKKWWSISVRIEDDVRITPTGYELLSHFAPRSIEEVEKMVQQKSLLDGYALPPLKTKITKKSF